MLDRTATRTNAARQRVHFVLEGGGAVSDLLAQMVHYFLIVLTIFSVCCIVLESVEEYRTNYPNFFVRFEVFTVVIFTVEYILRLWSAPDNIAYFGQPIWKARFKYSLTFAAIVDFLSIFPLYFSFLFASDVKVLLFMRLFRYFKITRYSPGMRSLLTALKSEQRALFACGVILLGLVLVTAAAIHVAEPAKFRNIPEGMWWSVVTLATVGYGDIVPDTVPGRVVASFTIIIGMLMVALPVGIIATAFANEIHRRDFVVNWAMLAKVPLFAGLQASEVAEIMPYLRSKTMAAGVLVCRKGEIAHSMYIIASGEVAVLVKGGPVLLREGSIFGEMAILTQGKRSADVRTTQLTKLLVLDAADFHALVERNPDIGVRVRDVAEKRAARKALEDPQSGKSS